MNKKIAFLICLLALLWLPLKAEATGCTVSAGEAISTLPGKTITVPVSISGNSGFTNFGIGLEYGEGLTLVSIQTADGETPYLCGSWTALNTAWKTAQKTTCGYVTSASATVVTDEGTLFTATFAVAENFSGSARITPVVHYLRNNKIAEQDPAFVPVSASASGTTVTAIARGDVNMDGMIEYDDVMLSYRATQEQGLLTEQQTEIGDLNRNGMIDEDEMNAIYQIYMGGS